MKKNIFFIMTTVMSTLLGTQQDTIDNRIALFATIKQEAHQAIWNKNSLTPEQLQLLLNFTHISFDIVSAEHKLQEEATFLLLMGWHLRYDRETFSNNTEHLLTIERSFERFKNLIKARNILAQAHEQLEERIAQPENKAVAAIAQTMAEHATQLIKYFSCTQESSITQTLTECVEHLNQTHAALHINAETYQALIDGTYPFEQQHDKKLQTIELAQTLAESSIANQTKTLLEMLESITQETKQIQTFGALAFYIYYQTIYEGMREHGFDTKGK